MPLQNTEKSFNFNISLSILNHLGRNLYRNFSTILGEAISNSWDAGAKNVYITIDRERDFFSIMDDGKGMNEDDFSNRFLRVGYSKRNEFGNTSPEGRAYIGRKGIGKLALLSCSKKVHILSKKEDNQPIGGIIDNSELNEAIKEDNEKYTLGKISSSPYHMELDRKKHGTFLVFEQLNESIYHTIEYLRTIIALYFRFSTIDPEFNIYLNGEKISVEDLNTLADKTEFLWNINNLSGDEFVDKIKTKIETPEVNLTLSLDTPDDFINGFIASVKKPKDLSIPGTGDVATIDLFVNGRLREKDIMRHIRTKRITESYLYGQINYNSLESDVDRFTSSREGIKEDDPKFKDFLEKFKNQVIAKVLSQWDPMRDNRGQEGDAESETFKRASKQRRAKALFDATVTEYEESITDTDSIHDDLEQWITELRKESEFNYPSYSECFLSENLTRRYIEHKGNEECPLTSRATTEVNRLREKEENNKRNAALGIDIRQNTGDLYYLDMSHLAYVAEKREEYNNPLALTGRAPEFKPIRDALMHTSVLTDEAKLRLTTIFNEIRARIKKLLKANG